VLIFTVFEEVQILQAALGPIDQRAVVGIALDTSNSRRIT